MEMVEADTQIINAEQEENNCQDKWRRSAQQEISPNLTPTGSLFD